MEARCWLTIASLQAGTWLTISGGTLAHTISLQTESRYRNTDILIRHLKRMAPQHRSYYVSSCSLQSYAVQVAANYGMENALCLHFFCNMAGSMAAWQPCISYLVSKTFRLGHGEKTRQEVLSTLRYLIII